MVDEPLAAETPEFGFELDEIRQLIELVETRGLAKLVVEEEDRRLVIRGLRPDNTSVQHPGTPSTTLVRTSAAVIAKLQAAHIKRVAVESPMVGVFYRSTSPDSAPLVDIGDRVEVGQAIGVIEAMKVFSEIPSDHAGVITEIVAKNGELVRQGAPLMFLKGE